MDRVGGDGMLGADEMIQDDAGAAPHLVLLNPANTTIIDRHWPMLTDGSGGDNYLPSG